jgi:mannose-6-phosphate isomerase
MNELYPMKFEPQYLEKIWGGNRLHTLFGRNLGRKKNIGESWEISGIEGRVSRVTNGFLKGNNLQELIEVYMGDLVGEKVFKEFGTEFPLLIKYIDACEILSIQVHPDDRAAALLNAGRGKTEMWYVIDAEKEAKIWIGFHKETSREEFLLSLKQKKLPDLMKMEKVSTGDVFYIPAGRIHSIGAGVFLAEIQQSSDVTYRIYDFDRRDPQGKQRELHIREALETIDYNCYPDYRTHYQRMTNKSSELVHSAYFHTNLLEITRSVERDFHLLDSFIIYLCLEGKCNLQCQDSMLALQTGDTVLIPASIEIFEIAPSRKATLLEVYIP